MPKNTTTKGMFQNCVTLESVDVHNWDLPNVTSVWDMFCGCTSLITVPGIGNWDFGSVYYAISMFNGCSNLQYLEDLSGWDMSKVTEGPGQVFIGCNSLVGGQGTSYAQHQVPVLDYAHVDGGTENPGYLTYKSVNP